jgi:hypothetical protein
LRLRKITGPGASIIYTLRRRASFKNKVERVLPPGASFDFQPKCPKTQAFYTFYPGFLTDMGRSFCRVQDSDSAAAWAVA